jgi:integrase
MAMSSIRQIHWIVSATFAAAVRWEWIRSNPADNAKKPKQRRPQPEPPSTAEAARIIEAAWVEDDDWGALVWLVMVTGMRRAEVLALRWADVDLEAGMLAIRRNYVRTGGRGIEKDTKTHQMRRISLDAETVGVLDEHRARTSSRLVHSASGRRTRHSCSPTGPFTTCPPIQVGCRAGTGECAARSASRVICTRCGTTRRPSC